MKKKQLHLPILLMILFFSLSSEAQTKKQPGKKQAAKTAVQKKSSVVPKSATQSTEITETSTPTAQAKQTTETQAAANSGKEVKATTVSNEEKTVKLSRGKEDQGATSYKTALGLKFLWGIALTGKHFFKEQHAVEAVVKYRGYSGVGADIGLGVLYEYHNNIKGVEGLKWYVGGGAYVGTFSFKDEIADYMDEYGSGSNFYFGLAGVLGLEYKIKGAPLAISADWQPSFQLKDTYGSSGFSAESGGIGVKYTF